MELKTARLTVLIDPNKKAAFERLCASQDRTASQVVRQLIRDYLAGHGVEFVASGAEPDEPDPTASRGADRVESSPPAGTARAARGRAPRRKPGA